MVPRATVWTLWMALVSCAQRQKVACAINNGLGRVPPLGWATWQTCGDESCGHDVCTEAEVKQVATAMQRNGLHAAGYTLIILDDCWVAPNRTSTGELTWDRTRFSAGIPGLVTWLNERGFRLGIYTSAGNATCTGLPGSRYHYQQDANTFSSWGVSYVKLGACACPARTPSVAPCMSLPVPIPECLCAVQIGVATSRTKSGREPVHIGHLQRR